MIKYYFKEENLRTKRCAFWKHDLRFNVCYYRYDLDSEWIYFGSCKPTEDFEGDGWKTITEEEYQELIFLEVL